MCAFVRAGAAVLIGSLLSHSACAVSLQQGADFRSAPRLLLPPIVLPDPLAPVEESSAATDLPRVVVADPRYRSIRVELPASEANAIGQDPQDLYRRLVKTRHAGANVVMVQNGRVFFVRAGYSELARAPQSFAVSSAPEQPMAAAEAKVAVSSGAELPLSLP